MEDSTVVNTRSEQVEHGLLGATAGVFQLAQDLLRVVKTEVAARDPADLIRIAGRLRHFGDVLAMLAAGMPDTATPAADA